MLQQKNKRWPLPTSRPRYLRVEVRTPQGAMLALTNPIWVSGSAQSHPAGK